MNVLIFVFDSIIDFLKMPLQFDGWTFSLWEVLIWSLVGGIAFSIVREVLFPD